MLVETRVNIDEREVWEKVWGNDGQGFAYWVTKARSWSGGDLDYYLNTDLSVELWVPNPQDFQIWTDEGDNHKVTLYALCRAYADLLAEGWTHCGHSLLSEHDSCVEDAILQRAVFGELVYG